MLLEFYGNIRCKLFWLLHSLLITFVHLKIFSYFAIHFFRKTMNNNLNVTYIWGKFIVLRA